MYKQYKLAIAKIIANWLINDFSKLRKEVGDLELFGKQLRQLADLVHYEIISTKTAKEVFKEMILTKQMPHVIVETKQLHQINDPELLEQLVNEVLADNEKLIEKYKGAQR